MEIAKMILITTLVMTSGCSSFKAAVGEYVGEAVKEKLVSDVDNLLEKRGLSLQEIRNVAFISSNGKTTPSDVANTIKDATKDLILLETKNYLEKKIIPDVASKNDLEGKADRIWNWLLGLIIAYLGKQLWSAKGDSKRDQRLSILEKLLGINVDSNPPNPIISKPTNNNN